MQMRPNPIVLIAEDHDDTRRVYSIILRHYGYEVAEARSGFEAVELARQLQPQLVLMDIGLPGLDGWQASRLLKSDPLTAAIPLIAFSARVDSTADLGGRASFDGYILKPIGPRELVQRVNAYMKLLVEEHPILGDTASYGVFEDPDAQPEMTA
jgi:two-component system, cell cycle response regulator DivK